MAKQKHKHSKSRHRNTGGGGGPPRPSSPRPASSRKRWGRGDRPDLWTTVASVAGGAGAALVSGLLVNVDALSPEQAAMGLIAGGGATAYFADGHARVVGNSAAAAGAGQLALAVLGRRALAKKTAQAAPAPAPAAAPQLLAQPQLVAPAPARQAASPQGTGYVYDVFRDAANQLDVLDDDEWRMGTRDAAGDPGEVYDESDLAAA